MAACGPSVCWHSSNIRSLSISCRCFNAATSISIPEASADKKAKKHTRNEIFSELMQSTQTERAQQNAWRQTMAESRKAQNEREDKWRDQEERWQQHDERRRDARLRLLEDQTDMLRCIVEVQERHRPPLQPLCNQPPSSPSSIASSPKRPRMRIDMYVEGTTDLMGMIMFLPFQPPEAKEKNFALIIERATTRYFPVYEKVLKEHSQQFLVGNQFSWADVHLLEAILMAEECKSDILSPFPQLQAFKGRISNIPTIKKFLQPGSQRKSPADDKSVAQVKKIFNI
ncbi:Glutathione S-transferase [Chelonia mydas]|uniref:glutathione transferase n=1 Tax=Chelonia mydas TaxID=8469 RepID=M7CH40_CHEMY|nr:Glutathione S-transferase [Chelonia mydas]